MECEAEDSSQLAKPERRTARLPMNRNRLFLKGEEWVALSVIINTVWLPIYLPLKVYIGTGCDSHGNHFFFLLTGNFALFFWISTDTRILKRLFRIIEQIYFWEIFKLILRAKRKINYLLKSIGKILQIARIFITLRNGKSYF